MIRYRLVCETAHTFEGWFRNSDDFEAQCSRKLVVCPQCGGTGIRKALMAPAVSTSRQKEALSPPAHAENEPGAAGTENDGAQAQFPSVAPDRPGVTGQNPAGSSGEAPARAAGPGQAMQPSALLPEDLRQKEIIEALRLVRKRIMQHSEHVGADFAAEARKIHYGEAEERSIYGETSLQDAEELLEEGIAVMPLPDLPDDKN